MGALTQDQQKALDFTLGRATNENLERAVGVHFKSEMEEDSGAGPVFLIVAKEGFDFAAGSLDDLYARLRDTEMIPVREGDDDEWFTETYAERLAEALGVPLWSL